MSKEIIEYVYKTKGLNYGIEQVMEHIVQAPWGYPVKYLCSYKGSAEVEKIIDKINKGNFPKSYGFKEAWANSDDNNEKKSLIAKYITDKYLANNDERIQNKLLKAGLITTLDPSKTIFPPYSTFTDEIIIFNKEIKGNKVLAKIFRNLDYFEKERNEFMKSKSSIEETDLLSKVNDVKVPLMNKYLGSTIIRDLQNDSYKGVNFLSLAEGETLMNIIRNIPDMDISDIEHMFYNMGNQIGNLDALWIKNHQKTLLHPDSHSGNYIYDTKTEQLHWIDISNIEPKAPIYPSIAKSNFKHEILMNTTIDYDRINQVDKYIPHKMSKPSFTQKEALKYYKQSQGSIAALKSLVKGYWDSAVKYGMDTKKIMSAWNEILEEKVGCWGVSEKYNDHIKQLNLKFAKYNLPELSLGQPPFVKNDIDSIETTTSLNETFMNDTNSISDPFVELFGE